MNLKDPISLEMIQAQWLPWLQGLPEAPARVRHLTLAVTLATSLGLGYATLLAPMQVAVSQAEQHRQTNADRQQTLLTQVAKLEQVRRDSRQLQDDLGRSYPDALDSAEYWQGLTELAEMQRLNLAAFKPGEETSRDLLATASAHFSASGSNQAVVSFTQAALSGGGLLGADSLTLKRGEKGRLQMELSLRHYRSLAIPPADRTLVNLPQPAMPRPARDLFAMPTERSSEATLVRPDPVQALQESLQGTRVIASISDARHAWALVQTADGGSQRVTVGDSLGGGVITRIDDRHLTVASGGAQRQLPIGK